MEGILGAVVLVVAAVVIFLIAKGTSWKSFPKAGKVIPGNFGEHWLSILVAVAGIGLALWAFTAEVRPTDAGNWSWKYWLPLLIIWGTLAALIALNQEKLGTASKVLQSILATGMFAALVVLPLVNYFWGEEPGQRRPAKAATAPNCTSASSCTHVRSPDGMTKKVSIPNGKSVCHDPEFWANLPRLGFKTTFKGGPERGVDVPADTFWYEPEPGVSIPRYWFVPEGSTTCS